MPDVDWESELDALEGSVERTLKSALAESGKWSNVLVIYQYATDSDTERVGYKQDANLTCANRAWLLRGIEHICMHEEHVSD